jgi:phosphoribosylglycinamide formyltransferase-1
MRDPKRVAILISGRGSNMRELVEQAKDYEVVLVASNKPLAAGLDWARTHGLPTWTWDSKIVAKEPWDQALSQALDDHRVGTIALAGFMRILSPGFIAEWRGRIVNIHPSLLPKYRGLDTHQRAIEAGDAVSGCSVHLVTEKLDAGEVLGSVEVPIAPGDTPDSLEQRVLAAEHLLYPRILSEFVQR